jgi:hypothetical protein
VNKLPVVDVLIMQNNAEYQVSHHFWGSMPKISAGLSKGISLNMADLRPWYDG